MNIAWHTFSVLADVVHGSFMKHGGVSHPPFEGLNFGMNQGDAEESVRRNRALGQKALNISHFASLYQEHKDQIHCIEAPGDRQGDGLITASRNLGLLIVHADCQAALFYDPVKQVIGAAHCGWRGNVLNIYEKMVRLMKSAYGCKSENIRVGISPSLGPNRAEFINYKKEFPPSFYRFQHRKEHFDLWKLAQWQLLEAGLIEQNIEIAKICTYENPDDYYSYRRAKTSGRHGSMIMLPQLSPHSASA